MMKTHVVTSAQLSKALHISASHVTGLKACGLPFVRTPNGDRYDLAACSRWYIDTIASKRPQPMGEAEADAEALRRIVEITEKEFTTQLRQHLIDLQSDRPMKRFLGILADLRLTPRDRYLAARCAQLIIGSSAPEDVAVMMCDPKAEPEVTWEREFRAGLVREMSGAR